MSKIKICGLSREADIEYANRCLPDYIGFVFAESRRQVDARTAARLKAKLDPRITAVGVFVNHPTDEIIRLCRDGVIGAVQLHGDEDEAYIQTLRAAAGAPIIRAFRVGDDALSVDTTADFALFDTFDARARGGTGKRFDWALIKDHRKPFFLAGGLNAGNLRDALALNPYCVDLSGGVETDGHKDFGKMAEAVAMVWEGDRI